MSDTSPALIAEIGGNHEGDFNYAKRLARLAIDSGVDIVKFQIYQGDTLVNKFESPDRNAHFKKFELTPSQHRYLADMCREGHVKYSASVWNADDISWIDPFIDIYKIGSGDLTAWNLIERIADIGKTIILSTGLSTLEEIRQCVELIRTRNSLYKSGENLYVLQCTSMYPSSPDEVNLMAMEEIKNKLSVRVGYSDHTVGVEALEVAASMGAEILEFHYTDKRGGKTFRDHLLSLEPNEVISLREKIKRISILRGTGRKLPTDGEISSGHTISFRRAVYPVRDLSENEIVRYEDLVLLRPNIGTDARLLNMVVGSRVKRYIKAFSPIFSEVDYG
jgi:sialic acid synthase SpsE